MSTQTEVVLLDGETDSTAIILYVSVQNIKVSPQVRCCRNLGIPTVPRPSAVGDSPVSRLTG